MKNIKAIIWDLDKTLYQFDDDFRLAGKAALEKVVVEMAPSIDEEAAKTYAEASYPMKTISKLNEDFGIDIEEAFFCYFTYLDESFLKPSPEFINEIKNSNVSFAVLSHANHDWVERALNKLGILEYIGINNIVTIEDLKHVGKNDGVKPYQIVLNKLNLNANEVMMVEDKDKNLKYARELGIKTVLVTNGDDKSDAKHADFIFENAFEFIKRFNFRKPKSVQYSSMRSLRPMRVGVG